MFVYLSSMGIYETMIFALVSYVVASLVLDNQYDFRELQMGYMKYFNKNYSIDTCAWSIYFIP